MQLLRNISLEYKSGIFFGIIAMIFTLLLGLISGITFNVIALRLLIMTPIYALIGTGIVFVVKKLVPELYEIFNRLPGGEGSRLEDEGNEADSGGSVDEGGLTEEDGVGNDTVSEFSEMDTDAIPRVVTGERPDLDNPIDVTGGKMGKHIVATEKVAKYEPKIMAEAIRTMMSKDED